MEYEQKSSNKRLRSRGYAIQFKDVADRLGVHPDSLKKWVRQYKSPKEFGQQQASNDEIRRLSEELKPVTEERDILKNPSRTLPETKGKVRIYTGI